MPVVAGASLVLAFAGCWLSGIRADRERPLADHARVAGMPGCSRYDLIAALDVCARRPRCSTSRIQNAVVLPILTRSSGASAAPSSLAAWGLFREARRTPVE